MELKKGHTYKASDNTPGGYIHIVDIKGDEVKAAFTRTPTGEKDTAYGVFTVDKAAILSYIECEYLPN